MRRNTSVLTIAAVALLASLALGHNIWIESDEIPLAIGTWGRFKQNVSLFQWTPFDSTRQVWDLTSYQGGRWARVGLDNYTHGRPPAPDSMQTDPPNPDVCEFDTLSQSIQYVYLYKNEFGLYIDGIDFEQLTYRFIGNYHPDGSVYTTPMYYGAGWISAITWQYELIPGILYVANEQHIKNIVAKGKVRVPMSGDYFWPCLVIKDHMTYSDNMGSLDTRWIYEWVVPGHFLGGNGVAAAQSQNGAAANFVNVENMFQMDQAQIPDWDLIPPEFANTTVWPDTNYTGPFLISSDITDDDAVGAESLFYRVNQGTWTAAGSDSSSADTYFYHIPPVTPPAQIDYYVWAKDQFCTDNNVDFWTTWPVCSPESTMVRFLVTQVGASDHRPTPYQTPELTVQPNPFRGSTRFTLANTSAPGRVQLFTASGELVRSLRLESSGIDLFATYWDGRDAQGQALPAGPYFYQVQAGNHSQHGKVLLHR